MNLKSLLRSVLALLLAGTVLSSSALAATDSVGLAEDAGAVPTDSADVISAALGEVGYIEGEKEYSKYGEWYGLANAYWCDMFVSWCAMKGGVPEEQFPRHCSCTSHVKLFQEMGRYQLSAARGGGYTPQQGDVIFFYNYAQYPTGKVCNHTGLVLYVEGGYVYTIEGNALANRLDYPYSAVAELRDGSLEPPDYVVVNRYPLDEPRIHGYGVPDYDNRTPLELEGFVDLGRHAESADVFQYLQDIGLMAATSEHTFSPNHGMSRGDFLKLAVDFFGIPDGSGTAAPFDDVPLDSPSYSAVMAARAAGLINGVDDNCFQPEHYISSGDAQTILDRIFVQLGLELQFPFSEGDYNYLLTPYTIRADIARAFYTLCWQMPLTEPFNGQVFLGETECPARDLGGVCYVPLQLLQQAIPELETKEAALEAWRSVPVWQTDRVLPDTVTLLHEENAFELNGFAYQGTPYVDLYAAVGFFALDLVCIEDEVPEKLPDSTVTIVRLENTNVF